MSIRRQRSRRGPIMIAGAVAGIVLGLVLVSVATGGGVEKKPARYAPFPAGSAARIERSIERGGPIFYSDPKGGTNAFYLDLEDGEIVALAVVPRGGQADCPIAWDRREQRYEDCENVEVDTNRLDRFRIQMSGAGSDKSVFVDIRTVERASS